MSSPSVAALLVERSPSRIAIALAPLPLLAGVALSLGTFQPAFVLAITGVVWATHHFDKNRRATSKRVTVDRDGVRVSRRKLVPQSKLRQGVLLPRHDGEPRVLLDGRGLQPSILVQVRDIEEGRHLLTLLGLDATQSVATFRVGPALHQRGWSLWAVRNAFLYLLVAGLLASYWGVLLAVLLSLSPLKYRMSTLIVGLDGVMVRHGWRRRFIGYQELEGVTKASLIQSGWSGVILKLRDGEELTVPIAMSRRDDGRTAMIAERIRDAMKACEGSGGGKDALLLRPEGHSLHDWVANLRAIGVGANASHRAAAIPRDELWRVVEDPKARLSARAAAAIALGTGGAEDGARARLLAIGETIARPKLRVVLAAAATGAPEQDLANAIAELEHDDETLHPGGAASA